MPEEQTEQAQDQDQAPAERVQDQDQAPAERVQDQEQLGPDDFAARTAAAEDLPLPERADAFAALHDELRTRLESGQAPPAGRTTGHRSDRAAGAGQVWGSGRRDGGPRA
ncbi:hypothetical protein [Curtobacterium sp. ER1/6]|uniref:hypothetical protein n=1 Tax=Curtobacterium sp. ER1/6 TaxID=1891920 RepID=UPI00084FA544|nr:hypothetical protein [Curtobacterium sp. ER1/6]OEI67257.1 hypothetical protein Cus16_3081 [Curtobacterium sp. ER1/6]